MNIELRDKIAHYLVETGHAHHKAFEATDGADPDWPIWYANHARDTFATDFGIDLTRSQLVYCLMNADFEHQARGGDAPWPEFYADEFVERYVAAESPAKDKLALYYFDGCPFCNRVRAAIDELGVDVEMRNIFENVEHRNDLVDARGRATVPVLRVYCADGDERWMPESADIVRYLQENYG